MNPYRFSYFQNVRIRKLLIYFCSIVRAKFLGFKQLMNARYTVIIDHETAYRYTTIYYMCNGFTGNRNIPICKQTAFGWFKIKGIMNDLFMKYLIDFFIIYISISE